MSGRGAVGTRRRAAPGRHGAPAGSQIPGPSAGGDVVPLTRRVGALLALRLSAVAVVALLAVLAGRTAADVGGGLAGVVATYLAVTSMLSAATVLIRHRPTAVTGFGLMLCLDGVAAEGVRYLLGPALPAQLLPAVFLVAVSLLGSFRTGMKLAVWQSLLRVVTDSGEEAGVLPAGPDRHPQLLLAELLLLWLLVLVVCLAAAVSERELRRRRYDAESLQSFAVRLHQCDAPAAVVECALEFVVDDLDARRALACSLSGDALSLLVGHQVAEPDPDGTAGRWTARSILALADRGRTARVLRLDARRDPWLVAHLPGARRVLVLALGGPDDEDGPVWVVLDHVQGFGAAIERRVVATAAQAAAIAGLALSRAALFQQSRAGALTDGLTGLPNRRAFDQLTTDLDAAGRPYTVVLADVDRFKAVNDTHGHQVGDDVLVAVGAALMATAPAGATVARYGGEEFVAVLPDTGPDDARAVAESLRSAVAAVREPLVVTASFGVATSRGRPAEQVIAAADDALYRAKHAGRNRVMTEETLTGEGLAGETLTEEGLSEEGLSEEGLIGVGAVAGTRTGDDGRIIGEDLGRS